MMWAAEHPPENKGGPRRLEGNAMTKHQVILAEYFTTEDLTLLFIVRADFAEPVVVEIPVSLDELRKYVITHFGTTLGSNKVRELDEGAFQERCARFIAPILPWAGEGDILWLVPHDVLHYLPLHAIRVEGRYLAERNPICYSPSASVMQHCHTRRKPARRGGALVLGDSRPDMPLPFAREEARRVAQLLGCEPLLGPAAAKAMVLETLADEASRQATDVLHVACHGYFDPAEALKSGLVLAPDGDGGTLTAEEIFSLQMRAELVTLSACESGVNERRPGDELIGLTRALIYAGTPSVLVSLWRVDDLATGLLMEQFYRAWRGGMGKAQALQAAQCWLMRLPRDDALALVKTARDEALAAHRLAGGEDARARGWWAALAARYTEIAEMYRLGDRPFAHPYYWAPFVLVGDWQ